MIIIKILKNNGEKVTQDLNLILQLHLDIYGEKKIDILIGKTKVDKNEPTR